MSTTETKEPDWKAIAMALAQRVNYAVQHCKSTGALLETDKDGNNVIRSWREYMADGLDMVPGVSVDREILAAMDLPPAKKRKAIAEIKEKRRQLAATGANL